MKELGILYNYKALGSDSTNLLERLCSYARRHACWEREESIKSSSCFGESGFKPSLMDSLPSRVKD